MIRVVAFVAHFFCGKMAGSLQLVKYSYYYEESRRKEEHKVQNTEQLFGVLVRLLVHVQQI